MLGAAAQATDRIPLTTYVTCPIFRYHPAVVAQKVATLQLLSDGRFTLGIGSGENLDEHVAGAGWPAADVRQETMVEALHNIRELFDGEGYTNYRGEHFDVAGELADVMVAVEPKPELGEWFDAAGGGRQAADRADADQLRHRPGRRRHPGAHAVPLVRPRLEGQRRAARAAGLRRGQLVREDDVAGSIPCGDDVDAVREAATAYADAGFLQIGGDQQTPSIEWAQQTLMPAWRDAFGV